MQDFFVVAQWDAPPRRGPLLYTVVGKLPPGRVRSAAAEELRAINRRIFPIWRASYQDERATWSMTDLRDLITRDSAAPGSVALGAVALVWLIACANASNLLVARVTSRRRELAVRTALGASRWRVVRYLLVESSLLAGAAAAIGLGLSYAGVRAMRGIGPEYFPRTQEIELAGPTIWVFAALAGAGLLIFGLIPALHGTGGRVEGSLRSGGRSATGTLGTRRLRRILVASQFAVATPLLVVCALLVSTLHTLGQVDLGFDSRNLVGGAISLPPAQYADDGRAEAFWEELRRRVASLPGVAAVAFSDGRPPDDVGNFNNFELETRRTPPDQSPPVCPWVAVSPDYFQMLGVRLLEGRLLDDRDARREQLEAVVVDRAWARRFFPGQTAVGQRFREGGCTDCPWTTVVGVVSDVRYAGLDRPDAGAVYWSMPPPTRTRYLMVRTSSAPGAMLPSIAEAVRDLDPTLPFSDVATIDDLVARSLDRPRSLTLLVVAFAAAAVLLSVMGIYGVMAYYVQQHAKDISIRVALGGSRGRIVKLIVGQAMRVVLAGIAAGVVAAAAATRLVQSLLFGVAPLDPIIFISATALLLLVALLACYGPARLATGLEPAVRLRDE
jgi:predicted permease